MKEIEMFRSVNVISESVENVYYYFCRVIPMHPNLREWVSQKNDSANGGVKIVGNTGDMLYEMLGFLPDPDQLLRDYNKLMYALDNKQFAQKLRPIYGYANEIKESALELRLSAIRTADFSNKEQQDKALSLLERFSKTFSDIYNDYEYWAESCSTLPAAAATGNKESDTPTEAPRPKPNTDKANGTLPEIPDEENFKKLMQEIAKLKPTIVTVLENDPNGYLWKWEKAMGLLDFVCGRFFCGDTVTVDRKGLVTIHFGSGSMPISKVAPFFSNVSSLGAQRKNWKSIGDKGGTEMRNGMPEFWEKLESILKELGY